MEEHRVAQLGPRAFYEIEHRVIRRQRPSSFVPGPEFLDHYRPALALAPGLPGQVGRYQERISMGVAHEGPPSPQPGQSFLGEFAAQIPVTDEAGAVPGQERKLFPEHVGELRGSRHR
jgi:hypothetical protein